MLSKSLHLSFILPPPLTHCSNKNCSYLGCGWPSHCKIQWLFPVLILFDPSPASVAHYILLGILSFVGYTNSLILPFFFFFGLHLCWPNLGSLCTKAKQKYRDRVMEEKKRVALSVGQVKGEHSGIAPQELCPLSLVVGRGYKVRQEYVIRT